MSAPKAGIARRAISRSYGLRRRAGAVAMRPTVNRFGDGLPGPIPMGAPPRGGRTLATMSERPASDPSESPVDIKPRSRDVTDGYERAPARAMLRAIGMTDDDWGKAQVGVCSSWNEVTPCNLPLGRLARRSKEGVIAAGGFPIEFTTIAVSDGISMGHEGMRASLVSREIIADSVEVMMHAERFDALVTFAGCDKSLPGMMMAAARLNVPSVFLYGGTILPGRGSKGEALDIVSVFEAVGAHAAPGRRPPPRRPRLRQRPGGRVPPRGGHPPAPDPHPRGVRERHHCGQRRRRIDQRRPPPAGHRHRGPGRARPRGLQPR